MSDPVSAPRRASTFAPKLGMTWATATRPGEEYLAGHVVMLVAYREMLRYGTKPNRGDWKGVVQARNAHGVGVGDGASSRRHAQRSARRLLDRIRWFRFRSCCRRACAVREGIRSSCGARREGCSRPLRGRVAIGRRGAMGMASVTRVLYELAGYSCENGPKKL
jgi:hypothetical protein